MSIGDIISVTIRPDGWSADVAAAAFVAGDVGQNISFEQLPNGITTISSQTGTAAVMAAAANANASGVTLYIRNYGKNSSRVNNWPFLHGVGCKGSRYRAANFPRDFAGIDVAVGAVTFVDDKSYATSGVGNGDYTPAVGSAARSRVASGQATIPFDLNGNSIVSGASAGAIQPQIIGGGYRNMLLMGIG